MCKEHGKNGLTLLELSIVLLVIGLIVGAVVVGQNMVRSAEIQSIVSDRERIHSSVYTFQRKYGHLPGDFPRAESFWSTDAGGCPISTDLTVKTQTCNGDGNGKLNAPAGGQTCAAATASSYEQEPFRVWQQLSNAGILPGNYTGVQGSLASILYGIPGTNIPVSTKIPGVGFQFMNFDGVTTTVGWFANARITNVLFIGLRDSSSNCLEPVMPFLSAPEARGIDTKIDDGMPGLGKMRVYSDNSLQCATSTTTTTANYGTTANSRVCSLIEFLEW